MRENITTMALSPSSLSASSSAYLDHHNFQVVGGSLLLACTATGLPPPRITFKAGEKEFSGEELDHGENFSTVQLSLSHLTAEQEGSYVCVAVNEYGADRASVEVDTEMQKCATKEFVSRWMFTRGLQSRWRVAVKRSRASSRQFSRATSTLIQGSRPQ